MDVDVLTSYERDHIRERQALPDRYLGLSPESSTSRLTAAKAALGPRLVILGHHYQRDEVIRFADYTGDSWKLSRQIAEAPATPTSSSSAASISWPRAPTSSPRRTSR